MGHLRKTVKNLAKVSEIDIEYAVSLATTKHFHKGETLFEKGEKCDILTIIEEGFAVMYHEEAGLRKGVVGFYKEGHYISDFYSYLTGEPVTFNFHFIEDTTIRVFTRDDINHLYTKSTVWERYGRNLAEKAYLNEMKHLYDAKFLSKDERYENLVQEENYILQRAPLYLIASYLDTTPETLSRIRRRLYEDAK